MRVGLIMKIKFDEGSIMEIKGNKILNNSIGKSKYWMEQAKTDYLICLEKLAHLNFCIKQGHNFEEENVNKLMYTITRLWNDLEAQQRIILDAEKTLNKKEIKEVVRNKAVEWIV